MGRPASQIRLELQVGTLDMRMPRPAVQGRMCSPNTRPARTGVLDAIADAKGERLQAGVHGHGHRVGRCETPVLSPAAVSSQCVLPFCSSTRTHTLTAVGHDGAWAPIITGERCIRLAGGHRAAVFGAFCREATARSGQPGSPSELPHLPRLPSSCMQSAPEALAQLPASCTSAPSCQRTSIDEDAALVACRVSVIVRIRRCMDSQHGRL